MAEFKQLNKVMCIDLRKNCEVIKGNKSLMGWAKLDHSCSKYAAPGLQGPFLFNNHYF